jgi:choline dehydrogenase
VRRGFTFRLDPPMLRFAFQGGSQEAMTRQSAAQDLGNFDYVIVGAGSAGCVLANRLSADPNTRVALLEAGGSDKYIWVRIPVGYLYCIGNPRTDWCFATQPQPGLNGRAIGYPRGRVLGGCSSINGMIYMRGQARDYDQWRQMGNRGWSWDDVLPYFLRSEDDSRGDDEFHAAGGEMRIEEQRLSWEILDAVREAAAQAGIPPTEDFNRGTNEGCGYFRVTQRRGVRVNAAQAFLKPVSRRPNLAVFTHAEVSAVRFDGRRAVGVTLTRHGKPSRITAAREIILAAGAVGSPTMLQRSGIGPGDVLRQHGIEIRHELAGVGENLQDHLQLRLAFKVANTRTLNEWAGTLVGKATIALQYALFRRGPMTMAPSQLGAFARSDPGRQTPDLELHVQPLSLERFGEALHSFPAITASACNLRPTSRGYIRIASPAPEAKPVIMPNYLATEEDRRVAVAAIRLTRRIVNAPALARFAPAEFKPGSALQSDEELARAAGDIGTTIFHPVGTCRMGDDNMAVVDDRLRVHGIAGLRVVDASVMPTITSGNTHAPVTMIAEKAADMIREDARGSGRRL